MSKKRKSLYQAPCSCGERKIHTNEIKPVRVFGLVFRKHEIVGKCIACKRICFRREAA